jgi:hypothetical protein
MKIALTHSRHGRVGDMDATLADSALAAMS